MYIIYLIFSWPIGIRPLCVAQFLFRPIGMGPIWIALFRPRLIIHLFLSRYIGIGLLWIALLLSLLIVIGPIWVALFLTWTIGMGHIVSNYAVCLACQCRDGALPQSELNDCWCWGDAAGLGALAHSFCCCRGLMDAAGFGALAHFCCWRCWLDAR